MRAMCKIVVSWHSETGIKQNLMEWLGRWSVIVSYRRAPANRSLNRIVPDGDWSMAGCMRQLQMLASPSKEHMFATAALLLIVASLSVMGCVSLVHNSRW